MPAKSDLPYRILLFPFPVKSQFGPAQPQCVAYHADGAEAHGRPRTWGQQRAAEGEQQARRDGDTDGVVAEGPEEILLDVPQGQPG